MKREEYLGVLVSCLNMKDTMDKVDNIIKRRKPSFIVAINPEKIMKSQNNKELVDIINSADIQIPDGIGIVIASKLRKGGIKERVTGIDLMMNICKLAEEKNYSVYLLGASEEVVLKAASVLSQKFNINIVGTHNGYFENEDEVIEDIIKKSPDILFTALGSPKQEFFINKNLIKMNVPLSMGVGGSYDVICGNIKRAPQWMMKYGLEWFYRLVKEPWRCKRMMALPKFLIRVALKR